MCRDQPILLFLRKNLIQAYCPHLPPGIKLTKSICFHLLMLAIANHLKIRLEQLGSEETFFRTLHGTRRGSAMREKLALLYYAASDAALVNPYLEIAPKYQLHHRPYWDRLVAEYMKQRKPRTKKPFFPQDIVEWLLTIPPENYRRLKSGIKKVEKGRKKK